MTRGCLSVDLDRQGCGVSSTATRVGGMAAGMIRQGCVPATRAERVGGLSVEASRRGGISCRLFMECSPSIRIPYLEIEPEIIWVLAGWSTDNDVLSNTFWNVQ